MLSALTYDHLPALVIAPKRVAEHVWPVEAPEWRPDLSLALASGSPAKRAKAIASGSDIVVIGRDNIKDIEPGQFRTIILDELSGFKNRGSQRWKIARKITDEAAYVWGLTGTPSPNGLMDLWAQVFLLDRGASLGKTLTKYRARYFDKGRVLPNGVVIEWLLKDGSQSAIEKAISEHSISMKARDLLELPPVTTNIVEVSLPPAATSAYRRMAKDLTTQIDENTYSAANAAVLTGKLSQITAGFLYGEEDSETTSIHKEKISAASEIVEGTGSPVLVFYRFRWERDALLDALPQARVIEYPDVIADWNRGQVPVLLAHPASAGHGLNLAAGGHTIIWTTLDWSAELWAQANARLDRQGQKHPVVIHVLTAPGTVDGMIFEALNGKISRQDAVMQALKSV